MHTSTDHSEDTTPAYDDRDFMAARDWEHAMARKVAAVLTRRLWCGTVGRAELLADIPFLAARAVAICGSDSDGWTTIDGIALVVRGLLTTDAEWETWEAADRAHEDAMAKL